MKDILDSGIDEYRKFVNKLPYENISRVADVFDMESQVAEFLALNGSTKDFQIFMTDIEPVRDKNSVIKKGCNHNLSDKIFTILKEQVEKGNTISFNRRYLMSGLTSIYNNKTLNNDEKEELQEMFIKYFIDGNEIYSAVSLARKNLGFDSIKKYLEMTKDSSWQEKEEYLTEILQPIFVQEMSEEYKRIEENIKKELEENTLTPEKLVELIEKSNLSDEEYYKNLKLEESKEDGKTKLLITKYNAITKTNMTAELDGTFLKQVIDDMNKKELDRAEEQLEKFAVDGIGEIKLCDVDYEQRFYYSNEKVDDIFGVLGEDEKSPYLVGGARTSKKLTDFTMKIPYTTISNQLQLENPILEMTTEQIEQFNESNPVDIKEHSYIYGKADGYHRKYVKDFEINGEQYHIKNSEWTNGGHYTVIWKGNEENYSDKALGLSSSISEWARDQEGVDQDYIINFINQNPKRFSKIYDERAGRYDCRGLFPTADIKCICKQIMEMEKESELHPIYEKNEFVENIVSSAEKKKELSVQNDKAKDLLNSYIKLNKGKGNNK